MTPVLQSGWLLQHVVPQQLLSAFWSNPDYCLSPQAGFWHVFCLLRLQNSTFHLASSLFVIMMQREGKRMYFSFTITHWWVHLSWSDYSHLPLLCCGLQTELSSQFGVRAPENTLGTILTIISMSVIIGWHIMLVIGGSKGVQIVWSCVCFKYGSSQGQVDHRVLSNSVPFNLFVCYLETALRPNSRLRDWFAESIMCKGCLFSTTLVLKWEVHTPNSASNVWIIVH